MKEDRSVRSWKGFVDGLKEAGRLMDEYTADLGPLERADGFRAICRALAANLEKVEADGLIPEILHDNTPNHKWFLDNPDGIYRHLVVDPKQTYLVRGNLGDACHTSIDAYRRGDKWFETSVSASVGDQQLDLDEEGNFELTISVDPPESGNWLAIDNDTWLVWIRQLFEDPRNDRSGWFTIKCMDPKPPPIIEPERFGKRLSVTGELVKQVTAITIMQARAEVEQTPNQVRRWEEMKGGAVYTLAGFDYMRGSWKLGPDEALVLEGRAVTCKHWNIVLYSRFLNSLEHRRRQVSLTGSRIERDRDGFYRLVIAHSDPGVPNWLDTEGREFGMFVIRWLLPEHETVVPTARVVTLDQAGAGG